MTPLSNQRCPATTASDEPPGPSKQRVARGPQASHGTSTGKLDNSDEGAGAGEAYDRSDRVCMARVYVRVSTNAEPLILAVRVRSTRASVGEGLNGYRGGWRERR